MAPVIPRAARALAAAAAEAAVQEVLVDPSRETLHAVSLASAAAAAATAVHYGWLLARLPKSHPRRHRRGRANQLISWLADQLRLETSRPSQIYAQLPDPPRGHARPR